MFAAEFIRVEDLDNKRHTLTVLACHEEDLGNRDKLVLSFGETGKRLPLNKTNAMMLSDELGDETDGWKGAKIIIGADKTMFQGKRVPCIRVLSAMKGSPADAAAAAAAAAKRAEGDGSGVTAF
jgi:hypothetical protein